MFHYRSRIMCLLPLLLLAGCSTGVGETQVTEAETDSDGLYLVNPFEFPTEAPFPKIDVPETSFNFGRTAIGTEGSHGFVVRNTGDAPLHLALGPKTCQCTLGSLNVNVLEPGAETEVLLTWKPESHATEFSKSAAIFTNVPEMPRIDFRVEGQVVPEIIVMPGTEWSAGMVNDAEGSMLDGVVYSMLTPDFVVTSIESSDEWLEVEYQEVSPSAVESMGGLKGYQVVCRVLPSCPLGEFRGVLTVHTDFESDEYREVVITVNGSRSGPFNITGRGWSGTRVWTIGYGKSRDWRRQIGPALVDHVTHGGTSGTGLDR